MSDTREDQEFNLGLNYVLALRPQRGNGVGNYVEFRRGIYAGYRNVGRVSAWISLKP